MRASEIRALSDAELAAQMEEARRELFNLRFRVASRQLANHRELRKAKRSVARTKTILRERELVASAEGGKGPS